MCAVPMNDNETEARIQELFPTEAHKIAIIKTLMALLGMQVIYLVESVASSPSELFKGCVGMSLSNCSAFINNNPQLLALMETWPILDEQQETYWTHQVKRSIEKLWPDICERLSV